MTEKLKEQATEGLAERPAERPDAGGVVRRGEAVEFVGRYPKHLGEAPHCQAGASFDCERPAVMEVYGLCMCETHGEEAASGALSELAHDLEQELGRFTNPYVRSLSPHLEHALSIGLGSLPPEARDSARNDALLLEAFPLEREEADMETRAYVEDPDHRRYNEPPFDVWMGYRRLISRHMRLAFEEGETWLVETLEQERIKIAREAAYALALEKEAGLR